MFPPDRDWQDAISFIQQKPPADAVGLCISELRTPFTVIKGWSTLLVRRLTEQWACQALAQTMLAYSQVFTDALITDELLDFRRLLIHRFPSIHTDLLSEDDQPVRVWSEPLDQIVLDIAQRMRDLITRIHTTNQELKRACLDKLDPDMQELPAVIDQNLERVRQVVDILVATTLAERIRQLTSGGE